MAEIFRGKATTTCRSTTSSNAGTRRPACTFRAPRHEVSQLALLGGSPFISGPLPKYNSIGEEEIEAVVGVMRSGELSAFYGSPGPEFLGGKMVRAFEAAWA